MGGQSALDEPGEYPHGSGAQGTGQDASGQGLVSPKMHQQGVDILSRLKARDSYSAVQAAQSSS